MIDSFRGKYAFLSNFYSCSIEYEELVYGSVEAAYQAAKTLDLSDRARFITYSAVEAKREGKKLKIRKDWNQVREGIMFELLQYKFSRHEELTQQLLDTEDEELVEENWWHDHFWGVCDGKGENKLGYMLMQLRRLLQVT